MNGAGRAEFHVDSQEFRAEADPAWLLADTVEYPVQVNGKVRGKVTVAADADQAAVEVAARADVASHLDGVTVRSGYLPLPSGQIDHPELTDAVASIEPCLETLIVGDARGGNLDDQMRFAGIELCEPAPRFPEQLFGKDSDIRLEHDRTSEPQRYFHADRQVIRQCPDHGDFAPRSPSGGPW